MTDIYFDKTNNVLINKLGIRDSRELEDIEYQLVGYRIFQLEVENLDKILSMRDYKEIHRYLFQDIYEWAGEYRTVEISKGSSIFLLRQFFSNAEQELDKLIKHYLLSGDKSEGFVCNELSVILCNLNYMHPFREGNGRTQREFVRQLALSKGYILDISYENKLYMEACIKDDEKIMLDALKKDIKK